MLCLPDSTGHSPVYSQVSATLQGLLTIRSFNMEKQLLERFHQAQDQHSAAWLLFLSAMRWLGLRVDMSLLTLHSLVLLVAMLLPLSGEYILLQETEIVA